DPCPWHAPEGEQRPVAELDRATHAHAVTAGELAVLAAEIEVSVGDAHLAEEVAEVRQDVVIDVRSEHRHATWDRYVEVRDRYRRPELSVGPENRQQAGQRLAYSGDEHLCGELAGGHRRNMLLPLRLQRLILHRHNR